MKKSKTIIRIPRLPALMLLLTITTALATSGQYEISWSTINSGGGTSIGGEYVLVGTIGQHDADWSSNDGYELLGGFWPGGPLCIIGFDDFARFAEHWLESPCNAANDNCGGADLDELGDVDLVDLSWFADYWLSSCPSTWQLR